MGIGLRMVTFANQAGESILLHSDIIRMIFRRQKIMWFKRCADLLIQALYDRLNFLGRNRLSTLRCNSRSSEAREIAAITAIRSVPRMALCERTLFISASTRAAASSRAACFSGAHASR